ncbi:hypothetical protein ITG08_22810 (plasmid) [Vibrio cyclitrophicus]|uniref:hypothetical protein n=1 Tax=Vibrio cyclitrophicus TaxID=47951 RepID=UPI000C819C1D|nr:hypothetical protein [Vibrio cyclitrophicus]PMH47300.1 hypothetical protein BCU67_21100 [Vibrio cyclitrophicus]PMK98598.1 hypothetical protein BCT87_20935 [Vibrio cyclitrophicus]UPR28190.1 hypothetical protein ITG08_22810 [Vibrio cyclitrophicus]
MNIRNSTYTRFTISEQVYQEAEARAKRQKVFTMSHRGEAANIVGCLGEVIAEQWMRKHGIEFIEELKETTHDYLVKKTITVDVKTKDRTVKPKNDYDNSAPLYNHNHQKPDYFLFISLERPSMRKDNDVRKYHTAYIVGGISYEELDQYGIKFLEGDIDWRNGTKFWTSCINIEMWQLIPLKELISIFKGELESPESTMPINKDVLRIMKQLIQQGKLPDRPLPREI